MLSLSALLYMGRDRPVDHKPLRPADGRFWHPVLDTQLFSIGDAVWIEDCPPGRHEVRGLKPHALLVRPIPPWEAWIRRWRGRMRRWWRRLWRRRR